MKITAVETLELAEFPFVLWLRVHTDAGLFGTGETFFAPQAVAGYVHGGAAAYLLGKDPRDIDLHSRVLGNVYNGARDTGAEMRGNSAIDIALWDIFGQAVGEPVWRLLGGRTHERVPIYNTCAGPDHARATKRQALFERNENWGLTAEDRSARPYEDLLGWRFAADDLAKSLLAEGIGAMKIWPFDIAAEVSMGARLSAADLDKALEPFAKIRDAVGNGMEIMVELHGLWTLAPALRIAQALESYAIAWLEEPIRFNELDALTVLARRTSIPLAVSERLATRQVFKQVMARGAASVIMIDVAWCGGLSEARKIANMAEGSELPVTLHDCTGPVAFAASCALSTTLPNVNYQEVVRAYFTGWYREIVDNVPSVTDGHVTALPGAGLGLALRPELFHRSDATVRVTRL